VRGGIFDEKSFRGEKNSEIQREVSEEGNGMDREMWSVGGFHGRIIAEFLLTLLASVPRLSWTVDLREEEFGGRVVFIDK